MRLPFWRNRSNTPDTTDSVDIWYLRKVYNTPDGEFVVMQDMSVHINQGTFSAFIGRSGSGKSTLINCITGIDLPTSGELYVDGVAVHRLNELQLPRW